MRTIPVILDYNRMLESFHSPKDSNAHRIQKKVGTKVHFIREMNSHVRKSSKCRKFNIVQDKMRDMLIEAGL